MIFGNINCTFLSSLGECRINRGYNLIQVKKAERMGCNTVCIIMQLSKKNVNEYIIYIIEEE